MKRIYFGNKYRSGGSFWKPYGFMGYLGRTLLFLLLLLLLLLILSLFGNSRVPADTAGGHGGGGSVGGGPQNGGVVTPYIDDWREPIAGGEEVGLPSPEENHLPPFETPVPNPDNGGATEVYPNMLYVIFDSDADDETFKTFAGEFSSLYPAPEHKITYYNKNSKTCVLSVPEQEREEICRILPEQITDVGFYVVPVEVLGLSASVDTPNDPILRDARKSWFLSPIQAQEAWEITQGSAEILVGIVDSYMDLSHPELSGDRCVNPYSILKDTDDVYPDAGVSETARCHGTMVTSIAVGNINNNEGAAGIAPKCKFIPVSLGEIPNTITQVEGLLYCMYQGASVINLSCGTDFSNVARNMSINDQIDFAERHGKPQEAMWDYVFSLAEKRNVTIVWAAGNENLFDAMDASKRNANTIRVSAVDRKLRKANFSNFGNFAARGLYESTISAPGVDIFGALPDNGYDSWDGTSFSAPIITGVVALLKSQNKDLTTGQIIKILQETGKPISNAPEIGNLVQIKDALVKAKQTVSSADVE